MNIWMKILAFLLCLWLISWLVGCERTFANQPYKPKSMPISVAPTSDYGNIGFAGFDKDTHKQLTIEVWVDITSYGKAENRGYVMFIDLERGEHRYIARSEGYGFVADDFWVKGGECDVLTILMERSE